MVEYVEANILTILTRTTVAKGEEHTVDNRDNSFLGDDTGLLAEYLRNLLVDGLYYKAALAGLVFALVTWLKLGFGWAFSTMNILGIIWLFLCFVKLGGDCLEWRGAAFQFGFGAGAACTITILSLLCFGKPAAIQVGSLAYGFFAAHYFLGCLHTLNILSGIRD
ncbi:MAG TPA: hypothetical protein PLE01_01620 [Syntrophothermus lipocalidus]|nr:hypothetical protein [Syntrophothermus lipocalidus]